MNKPLHTATVENLRRMIQSENFQEGDKLPTEPALAKSLGVSRTTLREAFQQLEGEGIIYRRHGIGTFVKSLMPSITVNLSIPRSLTVMIESLGLLPGTASMKVSTEPVYPDDLDRLSINPVSKVVRIERVRTANSQPVAYTIDVVPSWVMKKYPQWDGVTNFSLISHLTYSCSVKLKETVSSLIPLHNVQNVANKLEIDPSSHIFFFECVDHDTKGSPVLFSREYFSPWIFRFSVDRKP